MSVTVLRVLVEGKADGRSRKLYCQMYRLRLARCVDARLCVRRPNADEQRSPTRTTVPNARD